MKLFCIKPLSTLQEKSEDLTNVKNEFYVAELCFFLFYFPVKLLTTPQNYVGRVPPSGREPPPTQSCALTAHKHITH